MLNFQQHPHRRFNPLNAEWLLVSPHRTQRPWQGQRERVPQPAATPYVADCYLCPGNTRAGGHVNPPYTGTFVFENDYAALLPDTPAAEFHEQELLVAVGEAGICRVACFSPRHDLTVSRMERIDIRAVVDLWAEQYDEIGAKPSIRYVQVFENRGDMMGASNPHPHCQIWSTATIPNEPGKEQRAMLDYAARKNSCLLCDYAKLESRLGERVVCENDHFLVVTPFWALWPFETLVLAKRHAPSLSDLSGDERDGLADVLKRITTRYDNLFETPFPYSMGFHQKPTDGEEHPEAHLHAHYFPPLLRSATVRKFMVGFEMLGTPQRDLTPEQAAQRLRESSEVHYLQNLG
jgi:UDPglucose--hexose-1-phosphate uridylyltransferase